MTKAAEITTTHDRADLIEKEMLEIRHNCPRRRGLALLEGRTCTLAKEVWKEAS